MLDLERRYFHIIVVLFAERLVTDNVLRCGIPYASIIATSTLTVCHDCEVGNCRSGFFVRLLKRFYWSSILFSRCWKTNSVDLRKRILVQNDRKSSFWEHPQTIFLFKMKTWCIFDRYPRLRIKSNCSSKWRNFSLRELKNRETIRFIDIHSWWHVD